MDPKTSPSAPGGGSRTTHNPDVQAPEDVFALLTVDKIREDLNRRIRGMKVSLEHTRHVKTGSGERLTYDSFLAANRSAPTMLYEAMRNLVIAEVCLKEQVAELLVLVQKQANEGGKLKAQSETHLAYIQELELRLKDLQMHHDKIQHVVAQEEDVETLAEGGV